ncbi:SIS domain-containing protein [Polyplosphaeria fusca]|uniref:SIS domain-containing protein n=1 Tax=Polyplosphaeria fusca TaxID=682080 RepID=A0A9P4QLH8_9PLEO|nr:SIS domain-containing protein [Polyplosphaeria fusca]
MERISDNAHLAAPSSPPTLKRKRSDSALPSPPLSANDRHGIQTLERAVNVLSTAATALSQVTLLYQSDHKARDGLVKAVDLLVRINQGGGKLVICGVGKSGLVAMKLVATMKSLGLATSFLHAAEAVHGDLGDIRPNDAVLFISYSGRTAELLGLLEHMPPSIPILAITSHILPADCALLSARSSSILLPAPIHELEEESFGVCAPTTSTTVAIAVGDMLALTAAEALHDGKTKDIFRKNHPGGAIGSQCPGIGRDYEGKSCTKKAKGPISPS